MIASFLQSFFDTNNRPIPFTPLPLRLSILSSIIASIVISVGLSALSQIDFPVIQFVRASHVSFLDNLGRIGNRLGHGSTLVIISVVFLLAGYTLKQHQLKQIGVQTLLAHGIAGLITQIIKHAIGRPRPRMAHQDHWQIGPSFQSGLDAFPSGHSAASFAVAAVIARHYPRLAYVVYGGAAFVAFSRIIKGSHFPSDACVGALLGYVIGFIFSRPIESWRSSFLESVAQGLPFFVGGLGFMWIAVQKPALEFLYYVIFGAGILVMVTGFGIRLRTRIGKKNHAKDKHTRLGISSLLIALGLAVCTGSFLVIALSCLASLPWWMVHRHQTQTDKEGVHRKNSLNTIFSEMLLGVGILLLAGLIYQLRGVVPLV